MSLLTRIRTGDLSMAGNRRLFLLCLLLFLCSALFSFWIFFPAEVLQRYLVQQLVQQTGLKIEGGDAEMLLPFGLELDLSVHPNQAGLAPLLFKNLQVTPVWTQLFSGSPPVDLQAELAGGRFEAQASAKGRVQLELQAVEIAALQQADLPYRLEGKLTGRLDVEDSAAALNGKGAFDLLLQDSFLLGLDRFGLPERLTLGLLQLEGKFNQRRLSIEKILLTEGNIEMSGGGTLLLADTPEQTRLNLNIRLHPTQSTPDSLRGLIDLSGVKPTTDGSYLLRVAGTLKHPLLRK